MSFNLSFQHSDGTSKAMQIDAGELLFVVGANGAGKSGLMHQFAIQNQPNIRRIAAHRQTWMTSDAPDLTGANKMSVEKNMRDDENGMHSRYRDNYASVRTGMVIYELIDAENSRARCIAAEVDADRIGLAKDLSKASGPITIINQLLRLSNIPIEVSLINDGRLMASRNGGPLYSSTELSDGERNAILICGAVLTTPAEHLIIIDESERHLHRSIISPLLTLLFENRPDCAFVISTHDYELPLEKSDTRTLLVRSCEFAGTHISSWEADEFRSNAVIDETLKKDILGSRRKMLFVEGITTSLDKPLYSLIFPMVSVITKGNCRDVEQTVAGLAAGADFHWIKAFGIVDTDGLDESAISTKASRGVYAVPYYSVEAIYYHPKVIAAVASKQAVNLGIDAEVINVAATNAGLAEIAQHIDRLCEKAVKKFCRKMALEQIPNDDDILSSISFEVNVDGPQLLTDRKILLRAAIASDNWEKVLQLCPVRERGARTVIATNLRFLNYSDYEGAVRQLAATDAIILEFMRSLFSDLYTKLNE